MTLVSGNNVTTTALQNWQRRVLSKRLSAVTREIEFQHKRLIFAAFTEIFLTLKFL